MRVKLAYPSSHSDGSGKWVPPIVVTFQVQPFSTSMIMGERVARARISSANQTSCLFNHQFSGAMVVSRCFKKGNKWDIEDSEGSLWLSLNLDLS